MEIGTLFRCTVLALLAAAPGARAEPAAGLESLPRWSASRLAGTGGEPMPLRAVRAFEGLAFERPLCIVGVPAGTTAQERILVVEQDGNLWTFRDDAAVAERDLFLGLGEGAATGPPGRRPLRALGMVFHDEYPEKPFVFVSYNRRHGKGATNYAARFRVAELDPPRADRESEKLLLAWESNGHNGCDLKFGPDGMLYASSGDGASPGDPENVGQTTDNLLGSILRIDVKGIEEPPFHRVPRDNPFTGVAGIRPEVWAYGLRNPWRMNFRPGTNELWLGDNGDEHWEMVHLVRKGANHGWSAFEGSHPFRLANRLAGPTLEHTPPVVEHPHTEMRSVVGGLFYRGEALPGLRGHYLYGCYFTQKLWSFPVEGDTPGTPRRVAELGAPVVSFGEDAAGEPLVLAYDGGIYRLAAAEKKARARPFPKRLSGTGLFASTAEHRLAEGFIPYEVNAPAWRDGAGAERFFALAEGVEEKVQVQMVPPGLSKVPRERFRSTAGLDRWKFPTGSAFVQTFSLGEGEAARRVETQVMFKDRGEWKFLTYAWNAAQDDAALVAAEGEDRPIDLGGDEKRKWRFMGRTECAACHTQRAMFALGATIAQMNRDFDYTALGGRRGNQVATFEALGFFQRPLPRDREAWPRFVDPREESAGLDERARTYLHVNCAPCHRETGLGGRANFQLLYWLSLADTGAVGQRPLVGLPGIEDARVIAPGDAARSEVCRRMETREAGKMPLVGSEAVDEAGLALVRRWIDEMGKRAGAGD